MKSYYEIYGVILPVCMAAKVVKVMIMCYARDNKVI
jgi:hypothetical protein